MKIAVLVYGEPREIEASIKTWPFALTNCNVDYYFSLWATGRIVSHKLNETVDYSVNYSTIVNLNPTVACIYKKITPPDNSNHPVYMQLNILQKGIELILDTNIEYDLVVLMRTDLYFADEAKNTIESDFIKCIETDCSGVITNDIWCNESFIILKWKDFSLLSKINLCRILIDKFSVVCPIHPMIANIFKNCSTFIPETYQHIEIIRPNATNLLNPTLDEIRQKFFEWNGFYQLKL